SLMRAWRLPDLLVRISDDHRDSAPQVRNVLLAMRLARHTKDGWDNAAIPDDVRDIAQLLNMRSEATLRLLHDLDEYAALARDSTAIPRSGSGSTQHVVKERRVKGQVHVGDAGDVVIDRPGQHGVARRDDDVVAVAEVAGERRLRRRCVAALLQRLKP